MTLNSIYSNLKQKKGSSTYTVQEIEFHNGRYLGIDNLNRPCIFLTTTERAPRPPITTSRLILQLSRQYNISPTQAGIGDEYFHSIHLTSQEPKDIDAFLYILEGFLNNHEEVSITADSLVSFFESMRRLFSTATAQDLSFAQQGLWGELFVMRTTGGFTFWAPYWHTDVDGTFDFSTQRKRIEVKTSSSQQRIHQFAHRQIFADADEVLIASCLLHSDDAGMTLRQLIEEARSEFVNTDQYLKLERAIRSAGMGDPTENGPAYNLADAVHSLKWFRAADAPRFPLPEPEGVSYTHYKVDLTSTPSLTETELRDWLNAWRAANKN